MLELHSTIGALHCGEVAAALLKNENDISALVADNQYLEV